MIANAERWQGQLVDGKFLLGRVLGGSDRSAVFLVETGAGPTPAVIRLVETDSADEQLGRWQAAAKLHHPNVMQISESGRCQLDGKDLCYLVTEYAEENLAQIIPERPLTADEARQALRDVAAALGYIHGQNFVHGSLKPSNVFAVGETIKLSSESLASAGKAVSLGARGSPYDAPETGTGGAAHSSDIWSLGMTLAQVLTQRLPALDSLNKATLPPGIQQPFQEIIANCLEADPSRRWTAEQISARLAGPSASARAVPTPSTPIEGKKQSTRWVYVIPLIVVIVLAILFFPRSKAPEAKPPAQPAQQSPAERTPVGGGAGSANSSSAPATTQDCCDGRVATRMMPQISAGAQRTIQGKIRVQIDLTVDETGKVTDARFKSAGPSRYFAERAMEAARQWTFKPPVENGQALASEWRVKFLIGRRTIDDSAEQIRP